MNRFLRQVLIILVFTITLVIPTFATYSLIPGDTLDIKVVGHDELTSKQIITPDGTVSLPLVGRLDVQNKSLSELDSILTTGFAKYLKAPQVMATLVSKESKTDDALPYFVVLHDLKKDNWDVKSLKTSAEAWAWTNGRTYELLRNGKKIDSKELQPGDSLLVAYSKAPDFFEENWYKLLTAAGVITGIYLSLHH